jgi:hypothetical protein
LNHPITTHLIYQFFCGFISRPVAPPLFQGLRLGAFALQAEPRFRPFGGQRLRRNHVSIKTVLQADTHSLPTFFQHTPISRLADIPDRQSLTMFRGVRYSPLTEDAQSPTTPTVTEKRTGLERRRGCLAAFAAVVVALALGLAAWIVFHASHTTDGASLDIPVENLRHQQSSFRAKFEPQYEFRSLDASTDLLWDDDHLLTPNGGYLVREFDGEDSYFGITMFHQLHCLQALRTALQILTAQVNGTGSGELPHTHWRHGTHYLHCLDYLKQVSMS